MNISLKSTEGFPFRRNSDSKKLLALDLVEVNPIFDVQNATAELASELALSALGQAIL